MFKNKTILITGGAGYVGSILVSKLLNEGYKVRVIDFLMFGGESLLGFFGGKNFELINGDMRNRQLVDKALEGVDMVIHLAALVGEEACAFNSKTTWEINFETTKILTFLCKKHKIKRFIFASTCSNYGLVKGDKIVNEKFPLNSTTLYTESKIASEFFLLSETNSNFHPCILRFAMMFGLSPKMRFNLIVNDFTRDAVLKKKVTIYSPRAWRAFTHVDDAANAYLICLKASIKKISGEIFNVGTANFQKAQLVDLIKKHLPQTKIKIIKGKKDPRSYQISTAKIKKTLGFRPKNSVEEGFLEIKNALEKKVFINPYDFKYEAWYNEQMMFEYFKRRRNEKN